MNVEKAKQEVERREKALLKLNDQRENLSQGIVALERKKAAAERALAMGDESKRKEIRRIEDEIDRPRLKGLETLIEEARQEIEKAKENLAVASREKEQRWRIFKTEETMRDSQDLLAGLPKLLDEAIEAEVKSETTLGKIAVVWAILEGRGSFEGQKRAFEFILDIPNKLGERRKQAGLEYLDLPGPPPMVLKPSLPASPGVRFTREHAQAYERVRLEELRQRFEANEK
jgi:hypothetical protein